MSVQWDGFPLSPTTSQYFFSLFCAKSVVHQWDLYTDFYRITTAAVDFGESVYEEEKEFNILVIVFSLGSVCVRPDGGQSTAEVPPGAPARGWALWSQTTAPLPRGEWACVRDERVLYNDAI